MSEPKVRREASLLTIIGLSHAEHVANRATRRVSDDDHPACQEAITDDSALSVVPSRIFNLDGRTFKDRHCVSEVETTLHESLFSLSLIKGDSHLVIVYTKIIQIKAMRWVRFMYRLSGQLQTLGTPVNKAACLLLRPMPGFTGKSTEMRWSSSLRSLARRPTK
jgi:hypothetical protein